jgi:hypothetical protein
MRLETNAIHDRFDAGVQQLDDQHEQARTDQERALDGRPAEPYAGRDQHDGEHDFLTERGFVPPRGAQPGHRKQGGIEDAADTDVAGLSHGARARS